MHTHTYTHTETLAIELLVHSYRAHTTTVTERHAWLPARLTAGPAAIDRDAAPLSARYYIPTYSALRLNSSRFVHLRKTFTVFGISSRESRGLVGLGESCPKPSSLLGWETRFFNSNPPKTVFDQLLENSATSRQCLNVNRSASTGSI